MSSNVDAVRQTFLFQILLPSEKTEPQKENVSSTKKPPQTRPRQFQAQTETLACPQVSVCSTLYQKTFINNSMVVN